MATLGQALQPRDQRPNPVAIQSDVVAGGTAQTVQTSSGPVLNYTGAVRTTGSVLIIQLDGGRAAVGWKP